MNATGYFSLEDELWLGHRFQYRGTTLTRRFRGDRLPFACSFRRFARVSFRDTETRMDGSEANQCKSTFPERESLSSETSLLLKFSVDKSIK